MRRLTQLATLTYPPEWRRRYGAELHCLLEDSSRNGVARLRDIFDILKGGLIMRYTGSNVTRMAVTWGVLGLLLGGLVGLRTPDRYAASTMIAARVRGTEGQVANQPP